MASGQDAQASDLKKRSADLATVSTLYLKEASRLEDSINKRAGVVNQYAIDFDAARCEVRRRMGLLASRRK